MMDPKQASHDILNILERLRIMHDIARDQNYSMISKEELKQDLSEGLEKLEEKFVALLERQ